MRIPTKMGFKDYGLIQDLGYLFLIIIISANICVVESTRCPYCNEDFVSLGRHTWRCRARRTSSTPASTSGPTVNEGNINNGRPDPGNTSYLPTAPPGQETVAFIKCSCGRSCKGRRGLRAHQRSCTVHESLSKISEHNDPIIDHGHDPVDFDHSDSLDGDTNTNLGESVGNENMEVHYRPGLKLPKTTSDWALANAYFHSIFDIANIPSNIDQFVLTAQNKIYEYFEGTYGTVENDASGDYLTKYKDESIKSLKLKLKQLKSTNADLQEIKFVSRMIRSKLNNTAVVTEKKQLEKNLKQKFWTTCNDIFNKATNSIPTFSINACSTYFRRVLSVFRAHSFSNDPKLDSIHCLLPRLTSTTHHPHTRK